jgi:hypothetical protein
MIGAKDLSSPKSFGGEAGFTVKDTAEVSAVAEPHSQSDLCHAECGVFQHLFGLMDPIAL